MHLNFCKKRSELLIKVIRTAPAVVIRNTQGQSWWRPKQLRSIIRQQISSRKKEWQLNVLIMRENEQIRRKFTNVSSKIRTYQEKKTSKILTINFQRILPIYALQESCNKSLPFINRKTFEKRCLTETSWRVDFFWFSAVLSFELLHLLNSFWSIWK